MEKCSGTLNDKSRHRGAIHVISALSTMHSLVIGRIKTDEKSNEITAIPELLNMLDIKGKIITTDAMGYQKDIAEKIQKQGGGTWLGFDNIMVKVQLSGKIAFILELGVMLISSFDHLLTSLLKNYSDLPHPNRV